MKALEPKMPLPNRARVTEALKRVIQLYEAMNKKDQADQWRKKLDERKQSRKDSQK